MKKKVRLLSMALAIFIVLPMLLALSVSATEPEIGYCKAYADAADGELLYKADFRGDAHWKPKTGGADAYDTMNAVASADGKSVTLVAVKDHDKGRAVWGGALDTTMFRANGCAYTVEFTVTAEDQDQFVGFYPDWSTGFSVAPGQNKFSFGQWGNWIKVHANDYYFGSGSLTQTYAVEFAVSDTLRTVGGKQFYTVTEYRLLIKNGDSWSVVYALSEDVNCASIDNTSELASLQWSEADFETVLRFFRSPNQDKNITISDLNVYKGLRSSFIAAKQPLTGGTIDLNAKEDGELLYKVNFAGDENFTPGALIEGLPELTAAVDATDSGKVTLSVPAAEDGLYHFWGGEIKGLPLNATSQYTIFVTVERSAALSATDPMIGFSADGKYYVIGDSSYMQLTKCGMGKVRSAVKHANNPLYPIVGDHGTDYATTTEPFTQTWAIEIDGPNMNRAIRVYALDTDGIYQLVSNTDGGSNVQFMNENLSVYFFQKDADQPVAINSVEIYKGRTVEALNDAMMGDDDPAAPGENTENTTADNSGNTTPATTTTEPTAEKPEKKGCKSTIDSLWIVAIVIMAIPAVVIRK